MPNHNQLKRYQASGHTHFVTFSCYSRRPHLNNDPARIHFEETLETLRIRHRFELYGYVLMPEHVHLLLSEPQAHPLSTTLSVLKRLTSRGHKPFWQVRYYDFNVFTTGKHREKLKYMHRNPVARGLVENPEDWPWSSFRHYLTGERARVHITSHHTPPTHPSP
jgi:putative transposase